MNKPDKHIDQDFAAAVLVDFNTSLGALSELTERGRTLVSRIPADAEREQMLQYIARIRKGSEEVSRVAESIQEFARLVLIQISETPKNGHSDVRTPRGSDHHFPSLERPLDFPPTLRRVP